MSDYILREAAINEFCDDCMDREWCKNTGYSCSRINNINAVPAADVVEVVRCKDCKHWTGINCGYCEVWEHYISNSDYFCGSGERTGDNG